MPRGVKKKTAQPESLEKTLWDAAVKLRGNVAPADYKHYVLPLIFLRYCTLRYDERQEQIKREIKEASGTYDQKTLDQLLLERDEYTRKNVFVVPEKASWEYLVKSAREDNIKQIVDDALELMEQENPKLKGVLRRTYAGSNLDAENLRGLISLFSRDVFAQNHGKGIDVLGKTYEYFIGNFANTEGARGGEFFTPESVVRVLVECMEPKEGIVFDPACGSGGMFVQSDKFAEHSGSLSFYGQERIDTTMRLCKMNLMLHGLDGNIELGDSLTNDLHPDLKADFVIANPPFNLKEWGADKLDAKDKRLYIDGEKYAVTDSNANYMWMLHFIYHLAEGGTAGTVMANGAMTTAVKQEYEIRKAFVEAGLIDCVIQLPGQLFSQTGIPVCLFLFSKNRNGTKGFRERKDEVFFIDARKMGALKPGSKKQKQLSSEEIARIAKAYHSFRNADSLPDCEAGFCASANLDQLRKHDYKLTPGGYVGSEIDDMGDEEFDTRFESLVTQLKAHKDEAAALTAAIQDNLRKVGSTWL
ncbi:MAG: SAM-dependent DNA methyltransferase [Fimbriimonadales bacterium]|nr:SAM-dependent DNA methyltransferase [Fimbriimonadales bacterium]